jgi:hypothetical protein
MTMATGPKLRMDSAAAWPAPASTVAPPPSSAATMPRTAAPAKPMSSSTPSTNRAMSIAIEPTKTRTMPPKTNRPRSDQRMPDSPT